MPKIRYEAVGDVAHRMRNAGETGAEHGARLGELKAGGERSTRFCGELGVAAAQHGKPEMSITNRAADPDTITRPGLAATDLAPGGDLANGGQGQHRRTGRRDRVAAEKMHAELLLIGGEAIGEP